MNDRRILINLLVAMAVLFTGTGAAFAHSVSSDNHTVRTAASIESNSAENHGPSFASRFTAQSTSTAPSIEDVDVTDITEVSATITWMTPNASSTSVVMYGTNSNNLDSEASDLQLVKDHAVPLGSLSPATQYFFKVSSGNDVATTTDPNIYDFTTEEAELQKRAFVGVVDDISGGSVSLTLNGNQGTITISLPDDVFIKTPGGPNAGIFEVGARVVILAQKTDTGWVALRITVKPVKPVPPIVGIVTEVIDGNVTVLTKKGVMETFALTEEADDPAIGELVTAFGGSPGKGKGLVKADKIRQRLLKLLEDLANSNSDEEGSETQLVETLVETIENHEAQETEVLDEVLTQAPEDVQDTISSARGNSEKGKQRSQEAVAKAKAKFNISQGTGNSNGNGQGNNDKETSPGNSGTSGQGQGNNDDDQSPGNSGKNKSQGNGNSNGQGNNVNDSNPGNSGNEGQGGKDDGQSPGNSGKNKGQGNGNSNGQGNNVNDSNPGNSGNEGQGGKDDGQSPGNSGKNKGQGKKDDDSSPGNSGGNKGQGNGKGNSGGGSGNGKGKNK